MKKAEVLQETVRFVVFRRSGLPGYYRIPRSTISINHDEIGSHDNFCGGTIRVMPAAWRQQFNAVFSTVTRLILSASPQRSEGTGTFLQWLYPVSAKQLPVLLREVEDVSNNMFKPLVERFLEEYDTILNSIRCEIEKRDPQAWTLVSSRLPTREAIQKRAALRLIVVPVSFMTVEGQLIADTVYDEIVDGMCGSLEECIENLAQRVTEDKLIRKDSLNNIKRKIEVISQFDSLVPQDMKRRIHCVKENIKNVNLESLATSERQTILSSIIEDAKELANDLRKLISD